MSKKRLFDIPKELVHNTFEQIKNRKTSRIDRKKIREFGSNGSEQIDELWEQLSSGNYVPSPVRRAYRRKPTGGWRAVGVPAVRDHLVQTILRDQLSSSFKAHWHSNSFRHLRGKKAKKTAVETAGERCLRYDWALILDIEEFGENINHQMLMNMLCKYFDNPWVLQYTARMLQAPVQMEDGALVSRPNKGLPCDNTLSLFLADFFMHDIFDEWMKQKYPNVPFERHIDDIIIHCGSETQANALLSQITKRFNDFKLNRNEEKTKIVYCKDENRKESYKNTSFNFLEYTFRSHKENLKSGKRIFGPRKQ